jgi:hypothetical protein
MTKILCTVVCAVSLIGGATVVLAQSGRDLTEPTGTEANRLKTQYGGYYGYYGGGYGSYAYSPGLHRPGIGLTGTGDLSERLQRRYLQSTHLCR